MAIKIDLTGRRLLVTGASSGIGAAVCRTLASSGASIVMLARRGDRLEELSAELGAKVKGIVCDVTNNEALETAIQQASKILGGLDGVIAVAGRATVGTIATGSPQGWREIMDLNLLSPLVTVRYALTHFPSSGRRDVIIVGSAAAIASSVGVGIYGASKRGLRAAFDALRLELVPQRINAGLLMPGAFETEGMIGALAINGDIPPDMLPMLAEGGQPADPAILGDTVAFMLGLPDGVSMNEVVIRPTCQLNP